MKSFLWLLAAVLTAPALAGCGAEVHVSTGPRQLDGATLASRANTQLEKQNPDLAHGDLTCDDVEYEVDATSRCMRTVVFDDGRLVRIGATATIDSVTDGGHYQISVDDAPKEFGLTGKAVLAELVRQFAEQLKTKAPTGTCPPYLQGKVGATMTCVLDTGTTQQRVQVTVTTVDAKNFDTSYTFKAVD